MLSTVGRAQIKPTTECLRGVATYPLGDQRQGRYTMTLTHLTNHHYARAVLGRSDREVKIEDIVEMLLSISFAIQDAMLEWEWLGIDMGEWPPQKLDWEMYRIEHLAFCQQYGSVICWMASATMAHSLFSTKMYGMSRMAATACVQSAGRVIVTLAVCRMHGHTLMGV